MASFLRNYFQVFVKAKPYSLYVLFLLLVTFFLNQLDRFALTATSVETAQALQYGDMACLKLKDALASDANICSQYKGKNATLCDSLRRENDTNTTICQYNYSGKGYEYQIVSGPVFILVFTVMGIVVSVFADAFFKYRTFLLAGSLVLWSLMTFLTGFVEEYWQLVILRFGLGIGQAGCNPIATSIIADYFSMELRGSALSVYNWGIYFGYGISIAIGNLINEALGWRWVFYICGIPGFVVAPLIIFTIKRTERQEPSRETKALNSDEDSNNETIIKEAPADTLSNGQKLLKVAKVFLKPSLLMLCIAGSIRNAAGFVWGNNNNQYYKQLGQTPQEIAAYIGTIPIIFGLIGSFIGGFVSDLVAKKAGPTMRIWVLVISQIVAAPFAAGVLFFDPPYSYWFLIPTYIFGEMWIGVCLSVVVELVPEKLRITGIGVYFFIITNIGGNMQVLMPPVRTVLVSWFGLTDIQAFRGALYIFYPGEYVLGSALFLLTLVVLKRDINRLKEQS